MERQMLLDAIPNCLTATDLSLTTKYAGKVRDTYEMGDGRLLLVTTDRQSGFDRLLGAIPFKGQVLNRTSLYWFEQTRGIVGNHVILSPHANALIARKCKVLPIEFVVRGYMTGSTDTSIWTQYKNGVRNYCGHALPEGVQLWQGSAELEDHVPDLDPLLQQLLLRRCRLAGRHRDGKVAAGPHVRRRGA